MQLPRICQGKKSGGQEPRWRRRRNLSIRKTTIASHLPALPWISWKLNTAGPGAGT